MLSPIQSKPTRVALTRCSALLALCMGAACAPSQPRSPAATTILVNQLGYAPALPKHATLRDTASTPVAWQLLDQSGAQVAHGNSAPFGLDPASRMQVHGIDFSTFRASGRRFQLQVGAHRSHPFDIDQGVYTQLARDALRFFYHQRSGLTIRMPFAGAARWARPAGHTGDQHVECARELGPACTRDVAGGWYDAGDHGKYVVNAGISVWTLLHLHERSQERHTPALALNIPESDNATPDLLDEARWELLFMLKMQVPDAEPLAGMVHHKVHDAHWTPMGLAPHEDTEPRVLLPPSTAATLNLAAAAAQAARVFAPFDREFAERCLAAAQRAFAAAQAHPSLYAPAANNTGGGPYDDDDVADELAWAAAELYITTGQEGFKDALERSAHYAQIPEHLPRGEVCSLSWRDVATAATLSLALAAPASSQARQRAQASVVRAADRLLAIRSQQGFAIAFAPGPSSHIPWGSNSYVLNNALLLATAYDLRRDSRYLAGALSALDYVLGENPLDQSYVTGYGARPVLHPHHRFFARSRRADLPEAPAGFLAGGPNTGLQDPVAQAQLRDCAPLSCFIDDLDSYSTNEVAINWNASLAWLAGFADDWAHTLDTPPP